MRSPLLLRTCIGLIVLIDCSLVSPAGAALSQREHARSAAVTSGAYLVGQLDRYAGSYWARVAGRDMGLPPHENGHDEFAAQWLHDIVANLRGLPIGVFHQPFATPGFAFIPSHKPAQNLIVTVPGAVHPEQSVVVAAHYDGEPFSRGSAYDDTSGCMLLLGLAREMGKVWRSRGLPSLTVQFVLFDAEEQGLIGSTAFGFALRHGAIMPRPVLMIDEEQSGVGYPARPFGLLHEPPMPTYAVTSSPVPAGLGRQFGPPLPIDPQAVGSLISRLIGARNRVFQKLAKSYSPLSFRDGRAKVFTPADESLLKVGPSSICCSDDAPFAALGIPTATLSGDFDYYHSHGLTFSFPFDQPQDTVSALACDTGGSPTPGPALQAALDLPLNLSIELLDGYVPPARTSGIAVLSSIPGAGRSVRFAVTGGQSARWSFGDRATASGSSVVHTYKRAGSYRLSVQSGSARRNLIVHVPVKTPVYQSHLDPIHPPPIVTWHPQELQSINGCHGSGVSLRFR